MVRLSSNRISVRQHFTQWLLLPLMLLCLHAYGGQPSSKHYTASDGLASNTVYCAFQDSEGYLWFGTSAGVSRFDGTTFQNYTTANGLGGNEVRSIAEDAKGRIWFLPANGRNSYYHNNQFHHPGNTLILESLVAEDHSFRCIPGPYRDVYFPDRSGQILLLDSMDLPATARLPNNERMLFMEPAPRGGYFVGSQSALFLLESGRLNPVTAPWSQLPDDAQVRSIKSKGMLVSSGNELFFMRDTGMAALPLPATDEGIGHIRFIEHQPNNGIWLDTESNI